MNPADELFTGDLRLMVIRAIRADVWANPDKYAPEVVDAAKCLMVWTEFAEIFQKYSCTENE